MKHPSGILSLCLLLVLMLTLMISCGVQAPTTASTTTATTQATVTASTTQTPTSTSTPALSTTYAYKYGKNAPLEIGFVPDIVGPTDLLTYKKVFDHMISLAGSYEAANEFLRSVGISIDLFAGVAGVEPGAEHMDEMWESLRDLSASTWIISQTLAFAREYLS